MTTSMTQDTVVTSLESFRDWVKAHCEGRERGEAQVFLDRFFQCFGYGGVLEAKGTFEFAQKSSSKGGNTGFLDCLFPGVAIIEMKQRGSSLNEHYNQLLTYWTYCVPKPAVGILCNFDEFWIYDFNIQVDTPVQVLTLDELSQHPEALLFMLGQKPRFNQNLVDVTEDAAAEISGLYRSILSRREHYNATEEDIQRFVLQCVLCLFAEDIGLLPENLFTDLLNDCKRNPQDTYNLLHNLFSQMNSKKEANGGRFKGVRYFNGGLFNTITPVELEKSELEALHRLGYDYRWEKVRPSIFGTIFEKAIGHHQGSHFTSEVDIYKIVNPTIVRYWDERIEKAGTTITSLKKCLTDLRKYKVLDPACGSGNFLYIAFQEMKRLEKQLMDLIAKHAKSAKDLQGAQISMVSPMQLYGLEIKPFAVELARLTLEIGRKVAVNKFNLPEDVLPLDNLNQNIICADALFTDWPQVDAIIGNPPFTGGKYLRRDYGDEYAEKVYKAFPDVKGQPDFCVHWFRKSQEQPALRIGLVATNSISQGVSREASLKYIDANGGIIHDAISTQVWSGQANVHVSIVNWVKDKPPKEKFLDEKPVSIIINSLDTAFDVLEACVLQQNKSLSFESCGLRGKGFIISKDDAQAWIKANPENSKILKPMIDGNALVNRFQPLDWVIDFFDMPIEEAMSYKLPFQRALETVKPEREKNNRESRRKYWWHFGEKCPNMRKAFKGLHSYFAVPKVAKYTLFQAISVDILPCEANMVVASDDFCILGVLNSKLHRDWVKAQCSTLKGDTRYTNTTCFETFPFLWDAPEKLKQPVRDIMTELEAYRMDEMKTRQWGITKLYNAFFHEPASKLCQLHKKLDEAVCKVYGWKYSPDKNYNEDLFHLNQALYEQEQTPLLADGKPKRANRKKKP
jgi:hypothetical protein